MSLTRTCSKCKKTFGLEMFNKDKYRTRGLSYLCKKCNSEKNKNYRIKNDRKDYFNNYTRNKRKTDKNFSMRCWQRDQVHRMIKYGLNKTEPSKNYFPYTAKELKDHIENQFLPGMSWENHSIDGWHIDHIIPLTSFDTTKEEIAKAHALSNLRPLWAKDNLEKGDTMPTDKELKKIKKQMKKKR